MGYRLLYEAANGVEGHMLVDLLKQEGLEGRADGGSLQAAAGLLPVGLPVRVMVLEEDYPAARALVDRWNAEQPAPPVLALRHELDRNLDGRVDFVAQFDRYGTYESARVDDDFDGTFESENSYKDGDIELISVDTDGDGHADMRWFHVHGVLHSVDHIQPRTGRVVRTEYYRLGRMTHAERDLDGDGRMDRRTRYDAMGEVAATEDIR